MFEHLLHQEPPKVQGGPGPKDLIAGDLTDGYYGTLTSAEFITPQALADATLIGSAGGFTLNNDTRWHKFSIDGKVLYHPFLPIRWGVPWTLLNQYGLVIGTNIVTVQGARMKVRLMTGWNPGETPLLQNYPTTGAEKSEFNRMIYRISGEAPTSTNPGQFASYTLLELGLARSSISGHTEQRYLCQEFFNTNQCLVRNGNNGISSTNQWTASLTQTAGSQNPENAWRPVLELIG